MTPPLTHPRSTRLASPLRGNDRATFRTLLTVVLAFLLLAAIIGLGVIVVTPVELTEPYTEFYLLNTNGQAGNYPTNLDVGEEGTVIVGIENHEHRAMTYTVVVWTQRGIQEKQIMTVDDEERWRGQFSFAFEIRGERSLVFALYRGGSPDLGYQPYRRVFLNVTVR